MDNQTEAVKKHFNTYYKEWKEMYNGHPINNYIMQSRLKHIIKLIADLKIYDKPNTNIIEFGCGSGVLLSHIEYLFPNASIYGVDVSKQMLSIAKNSIQNNTKLIEASVDYYETDEKFDLIILVAVSEYLPKWEDTLIKLKALLKDNGQIIMTFNNIKSINSQIDIFYRHFLQKNKDISFKRRLTNIKYVKNEFKLQRLSIKKIVPYSFDYYFLRYMISENSILMSFFTYLFWTFDKIFSKTNLSIIFSRAFIILANNENTI